MGPAVEVWFWPSVVWRHAPSHTKTSWTVLFCSSEGDDSHDHDDDIIFEDFARLRLKGGETDAWKYAGLGLS